MDIQKTGQLIAQARKAHWLTGSICLTVPLASGSGTNL